MHVIVGHPMQRAADISRLYKGTALPLRDNLMTREKEMSGIDASIRRAIKEDRHFQVDRRRVYRLIESGRLPHERVGRKILINKQAASVALASPERRR